MTDVDKKFSEDVDKMHNLMIATVIKNGGDPEILLAATAAILIDYCKEIPSHGDHKAEAAEAILILFELMMTIAVNVTMEHVPDAEVMIARIFKNSIMVRIDKQS